MKQGEEFIIQPKDSHLKKDVCKIKVLENTRTTIFFQVEEGHEKVRLLHSDFEKDYRIIEKIENFKYKITAEQADLDFLKWFGNFRTPIDVDKSDKSKYDSILEKLKKQL
jgi:hypothetical protein